MNLSEKMYLTYPEAAKILRCSEKTIFNRVKAGELQSFSNGRLRVFAPEDLEAYMNRNASITRNDQPKTEDTGSN